jgi:lipopolysaccharide/colanic/teichoic acid biosynthesis glycosyltransferase
MTDAAMKDGLFEASPAAGEGSHPEAQGGEAAAGDARQLLTVVDSIAAPARDPVANALHAGEALVKRLLDVTIASLLLVLGLPLFALIGCAVWVDSGAPVMFRARRLGKDGRVFTMYKFRTMVRDAPALLTEYAHLNLGVGMVKIPNDPRVTRAGRWLRAFSLDELPQLWNVIRGDMSLVGPRPHDVGELSLADSAHRLRLSVRPGLTGLWQVAARDDPHLSTRVHHDLSYVQNWSLLIDAKIVLRTIPVVLKGCGDRIAQRESTVARESGSS